MYPDKELVIPPKYGRPRIPESCPYCDSKELHTTLDGTWDLIGALRSKYVEVKPDIPAFMPLKLFILRCGNGHLFKCVFTDQHEFPYKSTEIYNLTSPPKEVEDAYSVCPSCGKVYGKAAVICGGYASGWYGCGTKLRKEHGTRTDTETGKFKCPSCTWVSKTTTEASNHYYIIHGSRKFLHA